MNSERRSVPGPFSLLVTPDGSQAGVNDHFLRNSDDEPERGWLYDSSPCETLHSRSTPFGAATASQGQYDDHTVVNQLYDGSLAESVS